MKPVSSTFCPVHRAHRLPIRRRATVGISLLAAVASGAIVESHAQQAGYYSNPYSGAPQGSQNPSVAQQSAQGAPSTYSQQQTPGAIPPPVTIPPPDSYRPVYSSQPRYSQTGYPSEAQPYSQAPAQPQTMVTQIEVPIPPQTAEPPPHVQAEAYAPSASAQPNPFAAPPQSVPSPTPRFSMPIETRPYQEQPPQSAEYRQARTDGKVVENRIEDDPLTRVPSNIPYPDDYVSPSIVYDKGQEALPQPTPPPPGPPPPDFGAMIKKKEYAEVEEAAQANQDSKLAMALGWALYRDGKSSAAAEWFEKAIRWDSRNSEAAYGLALTYFRMGRYKEAEQLARGRASGYPQIKKMLGDLASRRAVSSFQSKNYAQARTTLLNINKNRALSREEQIMLGWCEFHLGNLEAARTTFVRLYRAKQDKYTADGIYAVYANQQNWSGLASVAHEYGGPLAALYQQHVGQQYYDKGLYRQAYRSDPCKYPELENISAPSVAVQGFARTRSGTEGTSKLTQTGAQLNATFYAQDAHRFDLKAGVTTLNAGTLKKETKIGEYPEDESRGFKQSPRTRYSNLVDFRIGWEYQNFLTPMAELGVTPINGAIDPTFVGRLGLKGIHDWGNWTVEAYRDPVRDSLLSYTGMVDPYTGKKWGRVTETGGRFSIYTKVKEDWTFYGAVGAGVLQGHNVEDNTHAEVAVALSKLIDVDGFDYLAVGPALSAGFYDKNSSEFTYGHGGYFSPEYLVQGTLGARFLTQQGGSSLLRGSVGVGIQTNRQAAAPLLPNNDDGRWYSAKDTTGLSLGVDLEGLYMLSSQWVIGGQIGVNVAPNYNDFSVRLSLQYFFEKRNGLFVQDFLRF